EQVSRLEDVARTLALMKNEQQQLGQDTAAKLESLVSRAPEVARKLLEFELRSIAAGDAAIRSLEDSLECRRRYLHGWIDASLEGRPEAKPLSDQVDAVPCDMSAGPRGLLESHVLMDSIRRRVANQAQQL